MAHAANQSIGAARRVSKAMGKRLRAATAAISAGVGVGDDESSFGGGRARVWFEEVLDDTRKKVLNLLEKSVFERFPRFERMVRRLLGTPKAPPPPTLPPPRPTGPLGAHVPGRDPDAERYRAEIQRRMRDAHTREHAGLRDDMERRRDDGDRGSEED